MDALLKAFERRGWKVTLGSLGRDRDHDWKSYVKVYGKQVPFGIRERVKRVENPPAKPARLPNGGMYTPLQSKYRDEPSGRLSLVLRSTWAGNAVETSLDDTPKHRVEDRLNEFVVAVVTHAYEALRWDAGAEDHQRNWAIEADRRAKEARRAEQERLRVVALEEQAVNWNRSQLLTSYLSAMRAAAQERFGEAAPNERFEEWLSWAEQHATSLDPLPTQLEQLTGLDP